jgi:hypothetical protein
MRFAYADPPYLGCAAFYKGMHDEWAIWDDPETHRRLIQRLSDEYPDGWAMSLNEPSLRVILPMCPPDCRTMPWVKPFASFKPGVGVAYAWEPMIVRGGRKRTRDDPTTRDWCAANITLKRGLVGAKPIKLIRWLLDVWHVQPGDVVDDLFPGSGAVTSALSSYSDKPSVPLTLFVEAA